MMRRASAATLLTMAIAGSAAAQTITRPTLTIVVVSGDGAVNRLFRRAAGPLVELRDGASRPLAGVPVRFSIRDGRNARFDDDRRSVTVVADDRGRARVTSLTPTAAGDVSIDVTATLRGNTAVATIRQTNVAADEAKPAPHGKRDAVIVGGIAAGAASGALALLNGGDDSKRTEDVTISTAPSIGLQAAPVQFSATLATVPGAATYQWDFGDGGIASGPAPTHVYDAAGVYTVKLSIGDGSRTSTAQHAIRVKNLTGRWSCFLCESPIVNFYNLVQTGATISGTYNNPAIGFVIVTGSVRTTPPYVTFGYPCAIISSTGTFDCSASFTGTPADHGDSMSGTVTQGGASAAVTTTRMP